jgi:MSHA biogenesis protein MshJ
MKKLSTWQSIIQRYDNKRLRERVLILTAACCLIFFIIDTLLLTPQIKHFKNWTDQLTSQQQESEKIDEQITRLSALLARTVSPAEQARLDALVGLIAQADALLAEDDGGSLNLPALLKTMLQTTPGLQLMSLRTLPVLPLVPMVRAQSDKATLKSSPPIFSGKDNADRDPPPTEVHQHGVEILIKGNYLALLPYMDALHRYPKRLFWTDAKLEVTAYPQALLRLTISTLSEQKVTPLR